MANARRFLHPLAICASALMLALPPARAEAQTGTIAGTVTDRATGGGVTATVAVYSWNGGQIQAVPTAAGTGAYAVSR